MGQKDLRRTKAIWTLLNPELAKERSMKRPAKKLERFRQSRIIAEENNLIGKE